MKRLQKSTQLFLFLILMPHAILYSMNWREKAMSVARAGLHTAEINYGLTGVMAATSGVIGFNVVRNVSTSMGIIDSIKKTVLEYPLLTTAAVVGSSLFMIKWAQFFRRCGSKFDNQSALTKPDRLGNFENLKAAFGELNRSGATVAVMVAENDREYREMVDRFGDAHAYIVPYCGQQWSLLRASHLYEAEVAFDQISARGGSGVILVEAGESALDTILDRFLKNKQLGGEKKEVRCVVAIQRPISYNLKRELSVTGQVEKDFFDSVVRVAPELIDFIDSCLNTTKEQLEEDDILRKDLEKNWRKVDEKHSFIAQLAYVAENAQFNKYVLEGFVEDVVKIANAQKPGKSFWEYMFSSLLLCCQALKNKKEIERFLAYTQSNNEKIVLEQKIVSPNLAKKSSEQQGPNSFQPGARDDRKKIAVTRSSAVSNIKASLKSRRENRQRNASESLTKNEDKQEEITDEED